ncbi:Repeat domain-containing protein [Robiginitalea myxolifaciens]|uniref:Repeat domain-containing protein n=1 Tax=Robiginitalea myxolifaciens TaxID=400055 RepID=A0A1I6G9I4_9FLAO|nr:VCBS repeat-containing protein [Robiginitalea myxolifaciens]SFR38838.1 Repeat domain-containing protein [Robiginitalea myxolifaciens]
MQIRPLHILCSLAVVFLGACQRGGDLFEEPSPEKTGITFENTLVETEELNILDYLYFYNGGGVAIGDIDGDGLADVYLSGNQVGNRLYRNLGDMEFEDITEKAGVAGNSTWNTGSVMADVNGDGLLDIYVCAVVGINGFRGHNELFINNGDMTFTESAAKYGLDLDSYSSNAAFFDYDLDGDLDLYLLNHAVHTQDSYGQASLRNQRSYETGDKLLRNDNGRFTDVSEAAGIYGGINGYGLGIAVSDFNQDGYPDLYIGNDFHEDDYYYLNNGDGTFSESLREYFGHTSRFSMGSDAADINNDGLPDLISLDMLPEDERPLKASEGDDNIQTQKMRIEQYGYYYQFTRNMLYVNQPDGRFTETALMSGVAATDWSWSALFADYDLDGNQDLFIANGIPKRPNDLDFVRFISSEQISNKMDNTRLVDQRALEMMPSGNAHNYIFQGEPGFGFTDRSDNWIRKDSSLSGASAWGDLDNDGDLDLVVSNLNAPVSVLVNRKNGAGNYLKLRLKYTEKNTFGIGTKAYLYSEGKTLFRELFPMRGFQASSEPILHFGLGEAAADSLKILWPDGSYQVVEQPGINTTLTLSPENTRPYVRAPRSANSIFKRIPDSLGLDFVHQEDNYTDFNREKLLPYSLADRGPATAVGDLDGDGDQDLFLGGSKRVPPAIYLQEDGWLQRLSPGDDSPWTRVLRDSIPENINAKLCDLDGDGMSELLIGNGGSDYFGDSENLQNMLYQNKGEGIIARPLDPGFANTAILRPMDYDGDGDLDVFVGNQSITGRFGQLPTSFLLENQEGNLVPDSGFAGEDLGMVTDALWTDFDADGKPDLLIIGEWMAPLLLRNTGEGFEQAPLDAPQGLWQAAAAHDIDADGDVDFILGNWGTNSKFSASAAHPMRIYLDDFDRNGSTDPILATHKGGAYYPLSGLDDLGSQLVFLRKKYPSYQRFAGKTLEEIFEAEQLEGARVLEVSELRSGYLRNNQGRFEFVPFPEAIQVSPVTSLLVYDFDGDGQEEVLAGGNYFGVKPYQGKFDGFSGVLIEGESKMSFGYELGLDFANKSLRDLEIIQLNGIPHLLAVFNNTTAQLYQLNSKE